MGWIELRLLIFYGVFSFILIFLFLSLHSCLVFSPRLLFKPVKSCRIKGSIENKLSMLFYYCLLLFYHYQDQFQSHYPTLYFINQLIILNCVPAKIYMKMNLLMLLSFSFCQSFQVGPAEHYLGNKRSCKM